MWPSIRSWNTQFHLSTYASSLRDAVISNRTKLSKSRFPTTSNNPKSNPYLYNVRFHKCRRSTGLLGLKSLGKLMNSYSMLGYSGYGLGVLGLLLKWGFTPNVISLTSLIRALCKELRVDKAVLLFHKMERDFGCAPDVVAYGTLLKGLCSAGNSRMAVNLHERIVGGTFGCVADLQPDVICYNTLIDGLCKDGFVSKAKELFHEMREKDIAPNVVTYNTLIDGLCKNGEWDEAKATFYEMIDQRVTPDEITFTVLINTLGKIAKE
uniref:Pentatricopeptide repeat-containing protein n=1 Tax=Kalanchoe fedtschenkoi TaxID=63787 RepID=A0A7N0USH9_KALFE